MLAAATIVGQVITAVLCVGFGGWLLVRALKKSEDPAKLLFKWLLTVPVLIGLVAVGRYLGKRMGGGVDPGTAFFCIITTAIVGLVLTFIWGPSIVSMISKRFESLYTGGDQEVEPRPVYSIAQARRKRGRYTEAVREVRKQLEKFPGDFEGQLLLAEIQAENLNDLQGAEVTIQRLCNQPGHAPRHLALALNCLADWHLKFAQDRDAARQDLEKIIALLPDSEMSARAAQRVGHLADTAYLLEAYDRPSVPVPPGVPNLGLLAAAQQPQAPEIAPEQLAADYVKHLEAHPLDTEAREKLAVLYADHYQRLDLAADQLEQLIGSPNQPAGNVVRWLNLLADLQIRHSAGYETVRQTVRRIVERFPDTAAAQMARNRLDYLKLELKAKAQSQTVKLGTYEQDIGLKKR